MPGVALGPGEGTEVGAEISILKVAYHWGGRPASGYMCISADSIHALFSFWDITPHPPSVPVLLVDLTPTLVQDGNM